MRECGQVVTGEARGPSGNLRFRASRGTEGEGVSFDVKVLSVHLPFSVDGKERVLYTILYTPSLPFLFFCVCSCVFTVSMSLVFPSPRFLCSLVCVLRLFILHSCFLFSFSFS